MGQPNVNDISFADNPNVGERIFGVLTPTSNDISDKLKFSNSHNATILVEEIVGGKEDCLDINTQSSNIFVNASSWKSGGLYIITAKGGSSGIRPAGFIDKHGSVVDLDIDNYSDECHKPSSNIDCSMWRTRDGSPIRWRSWMGCVPVFAPDQPHKCIMRLPKYIGIAVNRGYQLMKILKIMK